MFAIGVIWMLIVQLTSSQAEGDCNIIKPFEDLDSGTDVHAGTSGQFTNYFISCSEATWTGAMEYCQNYTEGHLLSIQSCEEDETVLELLAKEESVSKNQWIWTSGSFYDSWQWTNGKELVYENWAYNEPSHENESFKLGFVNDKISNEWSVRSCDSVGYFICQVSYFFIPLPPCPTPRDIIFLLDASANVKDEDFIMAKELLAKFMLPFRHDSRIGFIVYGSEPLSIFTIQNKLSKCRMEIAIKSAPRPPSSGYVPSIYSGIQAAIAQFREAGRGDGARKLVVFTDGQSSDQLNDAISEARKADIVTYAVGISTKNRFTLLTIADGNQEHVFMAPNLRSLNHTFMRLTNQLCSGGIPQGPPY